MVIYSEKVRKIVSKIPKGEVMTYKEVAVKAGNYKASRVVGTIMRKNFDKDIPCHRVVRSDGRIGNYNRGGEKVKHSLLVKEGAIKK